ncbi:hypothetical protein [Sphingomonas sp. ABOLH]|uniref:hypothetical protein n=1 Tax=Sphingomonas sp. ABOLH TaxID=1985881 RepID=UPI0019D08723|nr:hypothetical protein [Sphingomonas sp. ABOLH]
MWVLDSASASASALATVSDLPSATVWARVSVMGWASVSNRWLVVASPRSPHC